MAPIMAPIVEKAVEVLQGEVVKVDPPAPEPPLPMAAGARGLAVRNIAELNQVAELLCRGGLAAGKTVPQVACAIMVGLELGMGPATAIQQLYVTPQGKVEAEIGLLLALAQRCPEWRGYTTEWSGSVEKGDLACKSTVKRAGCPDVSMDMDLARARAWGWLALKKDRSGVDQNIWNKDPRLMLENRALAWAIRKQFSDAVTGLYARGEISEQNKE